MKQYDALVDAYIKRSETRGITQGLINNRRREIERFGLWVKRKRPRPRLEEIGAEIILDYLKDRSAFKARSTMQTIFSDLRCFFEYLVEENHWKKNPLRWIPGPKLIVNSHVPKSIQQQDIERLFQACFQAKGTLFQYQMPAIFLVLYSLGLRRNEVAALNFEDWNRKERTLKIFSSKSYRERYMPVPESLERALEAYLPVRQNLLAKKQNFDETALFINQKGQRLNTMAISGHLFRGAKKVGLNNFSVHQLRHTCATNLLNRGVSLPEVKMVLGHSCIDTTVRYTHVAGPERWQAIQKHPLNEFLKSNQEGATVCQPS